jgi:hypothetical protein
MAYILFWPESWGATSLGLTKVRGEGFLWIFGALFFLLAGMTLVRFFDWLEDRARQRRAFDDILLELRSRTQEEREILASAIRSSANTIKVHSREKDSAQVLLAKELLMMVKDPDQDGNFVGTYVIPTKVWRLMKGKDPRTFFLEVETKKVEFLKEMMAASGSLNDFLLAPSKLLIETLERRNAMFKISSSRKESVESDNELTRKEN